MKLGVICPPVLMGSLPFKDHRHAAKVVMKYSPEIPNWVQLPFFQEEGFFTQFSAGLPSLLNKKGTIYIDTSKESYGIELLDFMDDYSEANRKHLLSYETRFGLEGKYAGGMEALFNELNTSDIAPKALKGQITGPISFGYGVKNEKSIPLFFDEVLRDVITKHLEMISRWQVLKMKEKKKEVLIFIDEPILANFGSANFIGLTFEDVNKSLKKIIDAIHDEGALAGIHICGNTDWSVILSLNVDIVSFDAYKYSNIFLSYRQEICNFLERGGILAWGLVPTSSNDLVESVGIDFLFARFISAIQKISNLGIDIEKILLQSVITPACGTGLLSFECAERVLYLTMELSRRIRES